MPVRRATSDYFGIYFITLTCCRWENLFAESDGYSAAYKWFDHLKTKGHFVLGIMLRNLVCVTEAQSPRGGGLSAKLEEFKIKFRQGRAPHD